MICRLFVPIGALVAGLVATNAWATAGYDSATRIFRLDGGDATYAFGIDATGMIEPVYWGPRLPASEALHISPDIGNPASFEESEAQRPQEFPGWGGGLNTEPALKLSWPDGVRDVVLKYVRHRIMRDGIDVELSDIRLPLHVTLHYTVDPDTGIIGRSATIRNDSRVAVHLDQALSAAWTLPVGTDYRLQYLTGRWAAEWTLQQRPITPGSTVIESRRGSTGHQANPWFAIDRDGVSGEEVGPVWFGALGWSGSWRISIDQDTIGRVRVAGGFNPFDFAYPLKPGAELDTPVFYGGYSNRGMGGASRLLHRFERTTILPGAPTPHLRPIVYNSYEATGFDVTQANQSALAERAARLGVERFVMDDGWFGARDTDKTGLGDWTVNRRKFPDGLGPLIDKVHGLGMEFGLWIEPEMVNPDSDLYRAHPDWVINFKGRPRSQARNQFVLNLARADVRAHVLQVVDELVRRNAIDFLKWDYNRNWSEPGWPEAAPADAPKLYVDYVRNLYSILTEIRRRHPTLEIETCSGGGGRVDLGILRLADQAWTSDNTDPFDRLAIQDGFTHAYSPGVMEAWATGNRNYIDGRDTSLAYRMLSAMQGALGIGDDIAVWNDADMALAGRLVAAYKALRPTIQRGDLYRLIRPVGGSERSATPYVAPERSQAVLFAFLHSSSSFNVQPAIRLAGLDPARFYRMRAIDAAPAPDDPVQSGAYWMAHGVDIQMRGDFQAVGRIFDAVAGTPDTERPSS